MQACIAQSSGFQATIKVLSHELMFRPFRKVSDEDLALYERDHSDPSLVEFLRDYAEDGPAWKERVAQAQKELTAAMDALEARLGDSPWLTGEPYGLADISWVVNANRLAQAQVDLSPWPRFLAWAERAIARPAFDKAVTSYQP